LGRISAGGTVEFVIFTALFLGTATGAAYLLVRRWLPAGRAGGLLYGALLLLAPLVPVVGILAVVGALVVLVPAISGGQGRDRTADLAG